MIKKLFFVLILIFLYFSAPSLLYSDCAKTPVEPKITLYSSFGKLKFDTSKNTKQITEISKKLNILEDNYLINGLTSVKINLSIETNTFGFLSKNNKICVIPEDVKIFITFDSPVIYISEDLKNKPCQNNLTTYHELTHHHINIKTFEYYLPLFKLAAEKVIKETSPISVSNKNDINKISLMLSKKYNDRLSPLVNHIYKEMEKQQRYLDNKKNYEYEANICN